MAQPQPTTNRTISSDRREEPTTRNPTRDETRKASATTARSPGHRPVQEPTGAREQHEDNDDPMLLNPDFGGDVSVYSPTESATQVRAAIANVALAASTSEGDDGPSFTLPDVDRASREALDFESARGLASAGGGHAHGHQAQGGARLDDLRKQAPERRRGAHQPRGDMPRGK